eukprot:g18430.t1
MEMLEQMKKQAEQKATNLKVAGKKITEIEADDLSNISFDQIEKAREAQVLRERQDKIRQRKAESKRVDHLARALREEDQGLETPLLKNWTVDVESQDAEQLEKFESANAEEQRKQHEVALKEKEELLPFQRDAWADEKLEPRRDDFEEMRGAQIHRLEKKVVMNKIARARARYEKQQKERDAEEQAAARKRQEDERRRQADLEAREEAERQERMQREREEKRAAEETGKGMQHEKGHRCNTIRLEAIAISDAFVFYRTFQEARRREDDERRARAEEMRREREREIEEREQREQREREAAKRQNAERGQDGGSGGGGWRRDARDEGDNWRNQRSDVQRTNPMSRADEDNWRRGPAPAGDEREEDRRPPGKEPWRPSRAKGARKGTIAMPEAAKAEVVKMKAAGGDHSLTEARTRKAAGATEMKATCDAPTLGRKSPSAEPPHGRPALRPQRLHVRSV